MRQSHQRVILSLLTSGKYARPSIRSDPLSGRDSLSSPTMNFSDIDTLRRAIRGHLTLPPHHINLSQVCSASRAAYDGDETWRRLCLEIGIGRAKGSSSSWKEVYMRVVAHKKVCRVTKCYKYGIPCESIGWLVGFQFARASRGRETRWQVNNMA
jgi:hypothetical protein